MKARAAPLPPPWNARFSIEAPDSNVPEIYIHLDATYDVVDDWDAGFVGSTGCLNVTVLMRSRAGRGQMMVHWSYSDDVNVATSVRADQLGFVEGLHSAGRLVIDDVDGRRPRLPFEVVDRELDAEFYALRAFLTDLAVIEGWTGRDLGTSELVPVKEVRAIHDMATIIRTGKSSMNFQHIGLTVPEGRAAEIESGGHQFLVEIGIGLAGPSARCA
jgi:hypothetical protein